MRLTINFIATVLLVAIMSSCGQTETKKNVTEVKETQETQEAKVLVGNVLTKEDQAALTPSSVIQSLKDGNKRFTQNALTERDFPKQVKNTTSGQFPKAIVLSCVDSRVPVEHIFDKGVGDLFVARVAGNFVNVDMLGSMEFACKVAGSKVVLVMGHEHCGAVKAAVDNVKLGNITEMLSKITPAINNVKYEGERNSKNAEFVHMACESNVKNTINEIRLKSPILKEMEDKGEIKIVGAIYDLDSGKVTFL